LPRGLKRDLAIVTEYPFVDDRNSQNLSQRFASDGAGRLAARRVRTTTSHRKGGREPQSFTITHRCNDAHNGDFQGRMRSTLEIIESVCRAWPKDRCFLPAYVLSPSGLLDVI
jgi:hypothetical protein